MSLATAPGRFKIKVDVAFEAGDIVDVGHFSSCRFHRKTIAGIDEEADMLTFNDGTTYNYEQDPDTEIILRKPKRPKVVIP